ncbi:hypothetical protein BaRGS_00031040 [Batillaria attramentaria]|uniref:Uncharacterized protein n=1 Tax=Batillaria attramentaria TaxID=370345 RepID=A0ABD0JT42_9CAEN
MLQLLQTTYCDSGFQTSANVTRPCFERQLSLHPSKVNITCVRRHALTKCSLRRTCALQTVLVRKRGQRTRERGANNIGEKEQLKSHTAACYADLPVADGDSLYSAKARTGGPAVRMAEMKDIG